ncbi:hypothetical protein GCM10008931_31310 [Oceanobacillus oncorhynchi subsp. oncorhynchi]|uniref:hypothetical protein n=1 Tax=Oceanobacillus oncorhynchi TaxID=545501 RepID=UPI0031D48B8F
MKRLSAILLSILVSLLSDFIAVCILKFASVLLSYEVVTFKDLLREPILLWSLGIATILMIPFMTWALMNAEE